MKIGIIIPTRGDRPKLLSHALKMVSRQTIQPNYIEVVNDTPISSEKDVARRYEMGYNSLKDKCDVIACWEDDDWYKNTYLQQMIEEYIKAGEPQIFGINNTIYYHLRVMKWSRLIHEGRASMMSTLLKGGMDINWKGEKVFIDLQLWKDLKGVAIKFPDPINVGIKHGIGVTGGVGHTYNWRGYENDDRDGKFLQSLVGDDYKFYSTLFL